MNYDISNWHAECTNKGLQFAGDKLMVYCMDCGVVADLEAVGTKVSPADAVKVGQVDRMAIGKDSPNVSKGGSR